MQDEQKKCHKHLSRKGRQWPEWEPRQPHAQLTQQTISYSTYVT
jgi:hypothetical protein